MLGLMVLVALVVVVVLGLASGRCEVGCVSRAPPACRLSYRALVMLHVRG
jgi:hypothetical protein